MILDAMPRHERPDRPGLKFIGFWASENHPELPDPHGYIDPSWSPAERDQVTLYLRAAPEVQWWRGWAICRICGARVGFTDRCDDTYLWPDGFAHYVEAHFVRPPPLFLQHVNSRARG